MTEEEKASPAHGEKDRALSELEELITFYHNSSGRNMAFYRTIKVLQLVAAALVPVVAGLGVSAWITGTLGSLIVVLEGTQQLFQYHEYWISYRTACEALRSERFLYETRAGRYRLESESQVLLAEQIEAIRSQEVKRWASRQLVSKNERATS